MRLVHVGGRVCTLAIVAVLTAAPVTADAALSVSASGSTVAVSGDSDGNAVSVLTPAPGGANADGKSVLLDIDSRTSSATPDVNVSGGCSAFEAAPGLRRVTCTLGSPLSRVSAELGTGDDRYVHGFGNDRETHPYRLDLSLGEGNDELDISRRRAGVSASGGAGYDEVSYAGCNDCGGGVTANLGGGGSDSLGAEFESLHGSSGDDNLTGTARTSFPGAPCCSEVERIVGDDGNDTINDGGGPDLVFGDAGDDSIIAADGVKDSILCGSGSDTVQVDPTDELSQCEVAGAGAVVITSGPSGTVASRDATFEFRTVSLSPPAGHFECRLDDFGFAECISPKTFTNLPEGDHQVEVRYRPDVGDPGPVAVRLWTVRASCPDVQVGLAAVQGCFTERLANGQPTGVFETTGQAWIGGFHMRPKPGGKLVVDKNSASAPFTAEGPGVEWVLGPIAVPAPLPAILPFVTDFAISLNTAGTLERFINLPLLRGLSAQVKATWDAGGRGSKVEASVSMEELTKNVGTPLAGRLGLGGLSVGTLAAKLGLTLANGRPTEVTEGELEVPEYAVELKGTNPPIKEGFGGGRLKARRIDAQTVEWSGEVSMLFPWASRSGTNQGSVTGRLFYRNLEMAGVGFALSGFEVPIARTGWDFTGIQGDWIYRPSTSFNVGVTAQHHTAFAGVPVLKLTGNLKGLRLAEPDCANGKNPVEFVGTFNAPPLEQRNIGELKGQLLMCSYITNARNFAFEAGLSGELSIDAGTIKKLFAATGSAKGWFSGFDFNLDGSFQVQLPVFGQVGATGVFSSEGYAFCGRSGFIQAGFATDNWLVPPRDIGACDFTPFRAAPRASADPRAAASASARVRIPAGQSAFAIILRGATGGQAPRVRLVGPNGERFVTPAGTKALRGASAIIAPVDALHATYAYLRKPRAGAWRIETLDRTASIRRIATARQLPTPRVRATVKFNGSRVVVDWTSRHVPGQRIELVDRAGGIVTRIQPLTSKLRGRAIYTPANPLATRRAIDAVLLQDGAPRPGLTVRRYALKAPARPGRVSKPAARRSTKGLVVSWLAATRATGYVVTVEQGTEVLARAVTTKRTLTFSGMPTGTLTARIVPRDTFGRAGPSAVVRLTAGG